LKTRDCVNPRCPARLSSTSAHLSALRGMVVGKELPSRKVTSIVVVTVPSAARHELRGTGVGQEGEGAEARDGYAREVGAHSHGAAGRALLRADTSSLSEYKPLYFLTSPREVVPPGSFHLPGEFPRLWEVVRGCVRPKLSPPEVVGGSIRPKLSSDNLRGEGEVRGLGGARRILSQIPPFPRSGGWVGTSSHCYLFTQCSGVFQKLLIALPRVQPNQLGVSQPAAFSQRRDPRHVILWHPCQPRKMQAAISF